MDAEPLPCALVERFVDAARGDDGPRVTRILGKAHRAGADIVPELAATLELVTDDEALRGAVMLLSAATRCTPGRALTLRCYALSEEARTSGEVEETCRQEPAEWSEAALSLLPQADRDGDDALLEVCTSALACAEPGTPGVLEALLGQLEAHGRHAVYALAEHGDPAAAPALLEWFRALPAPGALSTAECSAGARAGMALRAWDVALDTTDLERLAPMMERETARLTAIADRISRESEALARPARLYDSRATDRPAAGPNAPCRCGSGRKTKRCCG